jgi:hypothetical protein
MSSKPLSDAELHDAIMARQATLSREEWQERIDAANEAFDRQEAVELAVARNGAHPKSRKASRESSQTAAEIIAST